MTIILILLLLQLAINLLVIYGIAMIINKKTAEANADNRELLTSILALRAVKAMHQKFSLRITKFIIGLVVLMAINYVWYFIVIMPTTSNNTLFFVLLLSFMTNFIAQFILLNNQYLIFNKMPSEHARLELACWTLNSILVAVIFALLIWK